MKIEIIQEKLNFFISKYQILINGKPEYFAKSKLLSIMPNIKIFDSNNECLCDVKEKFGTNRVLLDFEVYFRNQSTYKIKSESLLEHNIYTGAKKIDFYEQNGNLIGIFNKGNQIGLISKNRKSHFGGDKYTIELNDSVAKPISIISFALAYDNKFKEDNDSILHYDFGNTNVRPIKEIDENWKSD
jgi:hypothetical protein